MNVNLVDSETIARIGNRDVSSAVSFIVVLNSNDIRDIRFMVPETAWQVHKRLTEAVKYVYALLARPPLPPPNSPNMEPVQHSINQILFQAEDCPVNVRSASWQSQIDWDAIRLIPDLYYFLANGYVDFLPKGSADCPNWEDRIPTVFWRGSTTGLLNISLESIYRLPRYRLCREARLLGVRGDIGLTDVVQAANPDQHAKILALLATEDVIKPFVHFQKFTMHKFVVDIDGNANSWNFIQKLKLGACVLKVESRWRQWFSERLTPWEHFVPISQDLGNFHEIVEWCFTNDGEAKRIAANGREFALSMSFEEELRNADIQLRLSAFPVE